MTARIVVMEPFGHTVMAQPEHDATACALRRPTGA
jgi:hypothetical protein